MRGFGSLWRYMKHCLIAFVSDDGGFSLFSSDQSSVLRAIVSKKQSI